MYSLTRFTLFACLLLSSSCIPLQATAKPQTPTSQPALMPPVPPGPPQNLGPDPALFSAAILQAKAWGYPGEPQLTDVSAEKAYWATGCEKVSFPQACDPIPRQGWKMTVAYQNQQRWVFRGERADDLELIERTNFSLERRLPIPVRNEVKRLAANHLRLSPEVVLITKIEPQTFSNSCLGLGNPVETCVRKTIPGYRVTVAGTPKEQQIYRISRDNSHRRTEAIAGLPVRTDELPTAIARKLFNSAQTDLKRPIANLNISGVEATFDCFRNPNSPPNSPCLPLKSINGWKATVTNYQQSITYTVTLNGAILNKSKPR